MKVQIALLFAGLLQAIHAQKPVEKVTTLLENLAKKVHDSGKSEAEEYDKFACFCKDEVDTKQVAIKQGEISKEELLALINTKTAARDQLDSQVATLNGEVASLTEQLDTLKKTRDDDEKAYLARHKDLSKGLDALERAIEQLKASKTPAPVADLDLITLSSSLLGGDASRQATKLLSAIADPVDGVVGKTSGYDFHSTGVVGTLEKVLALFKTRKNDAEKAEHVAYETFALAQQGKLAEIQAAKDALDAKSLQSASETKAIADASSTLTNVQGVLLDDKDYLSTLATKCEAKAQEWDARSKLRTAELTALSQAIAVIKGTTAGLDDVNSRTQKARRPSLSFLALLASSRTTKATVHAKASMAVKKDLPPQDRELIAFLRSKAESLKSSTLSQLASRIENDPFGQVKKMIQDMLVRLIEQESQEASHKNWCDTQLGRVEQTKKEQKEAIDKAEDSVEALTAEIEELKKDRAQLDAEVKALRASADEQTTLRAQEKEKNQQTVRDALEGASSVEKVSLLLDEFYKSAKSQALVQLASRRTAAALKLKKGKDVPKGPFDHAYQGAQAEAWGILGFLETISSDFKRTAKEVEAAETAAQADYEELMAKTKESVSRKTSALEQFASEQTSAESKLSSAQQDHQQAATRLDQALDEYEKLKPACIESGETPEDRKSKREDELAALKQALEVLDSTSFSGSSAPFSAPLAAGYRSFSFLQRRA